jgi:hypothetical protein
MRAAANTLPLPATGPSLGAKWIKTNLLIAAVFPLTAGLLPFVIDRMVPQDISAVTFGWINATLAFGVVVVNMAVYAMLTGTVLAEKLPAFSRRVWVEVHLAFALALGFIMAKAHFVPSAPGNGSALITPSGQFDLVTFLVIALIIVPLLGAVLGGLQALVLRGAARGTLVWIAGFAMSFSAIAIVRELILAFNLVRFNSELATSIAANSLPFAFVMLMAILMLPAFNRLAPKN